MTEKMWFDFYLGDVLRTKERVQEALTLRKRSAWKKFKDVSSILWKKGLSLRIKQIFYETYVQTTLTYGVECWEMKEENERKPKTTKMRILHMLCGKTLKDKVNNEKIHEMTRVDSIDELLLKQRVR